VGCARSGLSQLVRERATLFRGGFAGPGSMLQGVRSGYNRRMQQRGQHHLEYAAICVNVA
jgi:hypothetical protein